MPTIVLPHPAISRNEDRLRAGRRTSLDVAGRVADHEAAAQAGHWTARATSGLCAASQFRACDSRSSLLVRVREQLVEVSPRRGEEVPKQRRGGPATAHGPQPCPPRSSALVRHDDHRHPQRNSATESPPRRLAAARSGRVGRMYSPRSFRSSLEGELGDFVVGEGLAVECLEQPDRRHHHGR